MPPRDHVPCSEAAHGHIICEGTGLHISRQAGIRAPSIPLLQICLLKRFCRNSDELFRLSSVLAPPSAAPDSTVFECDFDDKAYSDFSAYLVQTWHH